MRRLFHQYSVLREVDGCFVLSFEEWPIIDSESVSVFGARAIRMSTLLEKSG